LNINTLRRYVLGAQVQAWAEGRGVAGDDALVDALVSDGCFVVDLDAGQVFAPPWQESSPAPARPYLWALARRCGRALRNGGAAEARALLRAEAEGLLTRNGGELASRVAWQADSLIQADAELRDGGLWVFEADEPRRLKAWVPFETLESVSPLGDKAVEVRYQSSGGWASHRPSRDRAAAVLTLEDDALASAWAPGGADTYDASARVEGQFLLVHRCIRPRATQAAGLIEALHAGQPAVATPRGAILRTLGGRQLAAAAWWLSASVPRRASTARPVSRGR